MLKITFPFGQVTIGVLSHRTQKQGLIHHIADIRTSGKVEKTYLKHEVIDLVSRALDFCPLSHPIRGSRVVIEKGHNFYELHWNTESGRGENYAKRVN
jgi:hypothetical protein